MKKTTAKRLLLLALVIAVSAAALAGFALSAIPEDQSHLIEDLYEQNRQLRQELEALNTRLDKLETVVSLQDWTLEVSPWADSTGADITLTAAPSIYQEGVSATFLVLLDGVQIVSVPCVWDGNAFTATASLNAADGYSYYCQLSSAGGTRQLPLATPDNPVPEIPVYLLSSLSAYCNLTVNDWVETRGTVLTLTDACAQVQLPLICAAGNVEIVTADLVLRLNGAESIRIPIKLAPSEVAGSFDLTLTNAQFPMPELEEGDSLELYLEVRLSDGRNLQAFGISWQKIGNQLSSAVG